MSASSASKSSKQKVVYQAPVVDHSQNAESSTTDPKPSAPSTSPSGSSSNTTNTNHIFQHPGIRKCLWEILSLAVPPIDTGSKYPKSTAKPSQSSTAESSQSSTAEPSQSSTAEPSQSSTDKPPKVFICFGCAKALENRIFFTDFSPQADNVRDTCETCKKIRQSGFKMTTRQYREVELYYACYIVQIVKKFGDIEKAELLKESSKLYLELEKKRAPVKLKHGEYRPYLG